MHPLPISHHRDAAGSGCPLPPLLGQYSLFRAPGLGLPVQVDETQEVHTELEQDREDGVQVEDIGQGPFLGQGLEGLQWWRGAKRWVGVKAQRAFRRPGAQGGHHILRLRVSTSL